MSESSAVPGAPSASKKMKVILAFVVIAIVFVIALVMFKKPGETSIPGTGNTASATENAAAWSAIMPRPPLPLPPNLTGSPTIVDTAPSDTPVMADAVRMPPRRENVGVDDKNTRAILAQNMRENKVEFAIMNLSDKNPMHVLNKGRTSRAIGTIEVTGILVSANVEVELDGNVKNNDNSSAWHVSIVRDGTVIYNMGFMIASTKSPQFVGANVNVLKSGYSLRSCANGSVFNPNSTCDISRIGESKKVPALVRLVPGDKVVVVADVWHPDQTLMLKSASVMLQIAKV
jgi:hypothetical protein